MVLFGKNQFEIGFEFEFLNIQRFNMAISKNFYENILWNCRFISATFLWIWPHYESLTSTYYHEHSLAVPSNQEILSSATNFTLHC